MCAGARRGHFRPREGLRGVQAPGEQVVQAGAQQLLAEQREERGCAQVFGRPGQRLVHGLCLQDAGDALGQYVEARVDAGLGGMRLEQFGAQAVNRADARGVEIAVEAVPARARRVAGGQRLDEPSQAVAYAVAHLARGLLGKGDGDELLRAHLRVRGEQVEVARDERARFAGARARGHDHVAAARGDRRDLLVAGRLGDTGCARAARPTRRRRTRFVAGDAQQRPLLWLSAAPRVGRSASKSRPRSSRAAVVRRARHKGAGMDAAHRFPGIRDG
jgi:hypothetical protein